MSNNIAERRKMSHLFASVGDQVFLMDSQYLSRESNFRSASTTPKTTPTNSSQSAWDEDLTIHTHDGQYSNLTRSPRSRSRCGTTLIEIIPPEELRAKTSPPDFSINGPRKHRTNDQNMDEYIAPGVKVLMCYNEGGELVPASTINEPRTAESLTVLQLMIIIKKAYHHDLRSKLSKLLNPHPGGEDPVHPEDSIWAYRLSSWDLRIRTPKSVNDLPSADESSSDTVRRVLEVGASDGDWCFAIKKQQPDFVVHGVDDTDHWNCIDRGVTLQDFMKAPIIQGAGGEYFGGTTMSTDLPEFTERNLNCLLNHENPLPRNYYEFIHGRGIFDRIESYKAFLEDIRCLLKPDGVVEFIEKDPRPRVALMKTTTEESGDAHDNKEPHENKSRRGKRSSAATDWTDNIEDRFKDPTDNDLATDVPGWSERVARRISAYARPRDGVPAPNLKSYLEGAGFWDVKQSIWPIPVGGSTKNGTYLKDYLLYQVEIEDAIPKLRLAFPKVELRAMESGKYHLNIHIVTGRKPKYLRMGDLMPDGQRMEMSVSTYNTMAKFDALKSTQWKRFDLKSNLKGFMQNLTTLTCAPESLHLNPQISPDALHHIGRQPDNLNPFDAPPFVSYDGAQSTSLR